MCLWVYLCKCLYVFAFGCVFVDVRSRACTCINVCIYVHVAVWSLGAFV